MRHEIFTPAGIERKNAKIFVGLAIGVPFNWLHDPDLQFPNIFILLVPYKNPSIHIPLQCLRPCRTLLETLRMYLYPANGLMISFLEQYYFLLTKKKAQKKNKDPSLYFTLFFQLLLRNHSLLTPINSGHRDRDSFKSTR